MQRWEDGKPVCPHCELSIKPYIIEGGKRYKCDNKECRKKFSVTVGTVFENSKIKLSLWFASIYLATSRKKGVSSLQLSRDIGVTQKTAWFMLHRIREMLKEEAPEMLTEVVQLDETYIGGKEKNKHRDKRTPQSQGRSTKTKTPVFGMVSEGKVYNQVVPNTSAKTLKPIIYSYVKEGATIVTDEWLAYRGLSKNFDHKTVHHKQEQYMVDGFHNNSIEGYWSHLKRMILGNYHSISRKHTQSYINESAYRYNTRTVTDCERFCNTLLKTDGRLTYKSLIQK